eukprot:gene5518-5928_t
MCSRVTCSKCGKPTWVGCGFHVEQALAGVKPEDRCKCERSGCAVSKSSATNSTNLRGFIPSRI